MKNNLAICSWSGGKDSCLACFKAIQNGFEVKHLLNFVSRGTGRGCFHGIERALLKLQAECIGIGLVHYEVSPDMQEYEEEFKSAVTGLKGQDIETMVFGDIYLVEHQSWIERVCADIPIRAVEPLWDKDPRKIIEEFVGSGFKAIIVSCKADVMGQEFLGRQVDLQLIDELVARGVCPCGEKGEYHTLVIDGPMFKRPIEIVQSQAVLKQGFWPHWFLDIQHYRLGKGTPGVIPETAPQR